MDWRQKFEQSLNQGYDVSRKLFGKAKQRATELGEYGVLSLEVRQLEQKHTDLLTRLGSKVHTLLVDEKRSTVTAKSQGVKELLEELEDVRRELDRKRHLLKEHDQHSEGTGEEDSGQTTGEGASREDDDEQSRGEDESGRYTDPKQ